jgi:hypothetical protein
MPRPSAKLNVATLRSRARFHPKSQVRLKKLAVAVLLRDALLATKGVKDGAVQGRYWTSRPPGALPQVRKTLDTARKLSSTLGPTPGGLAGFPWRRPHSKSMERLLSRPPDYPAVIDFVSVRSSQFHKLQQVLSRSLLIPREENWVGDLVPNRVPEPVDICCAHGL